MLGAERQIRPLFDGVIASLVPVPLRDGDGNPIELVQASYADFIWGLPPVADPLYPSLGVSLAGQLGKLPNKIIQVGEESVAADAGIDETRYYRVQDGELFPCPGGTESEGADIDAVEVLNPSP